MSNELLLVHINSGKVELMPSFCRVYFWGRHITVKNVDRFKMGFCHWDGNFGWTNNATFLHYDGCT